MEKLNWEVYKALCVALFWCEKGWEQQTVAEAWVTIDWNEGKKEKASEKLIQERVPVTESVKPKIDSSSRLWKGIRIQRRAEKCHYTGVFCSLARRNAQNFY